MIMTYFYVAAVDFAVVYLYLSFFYNLFLIQSHVEDQSVVDSEQRQSRLI